MKQQTISYRLQNNVPLKTAEEVLAVEAATGISRHELRPDLYPLDDAPHASSVPPVDQRAAGGIPPSQTGRSSGPAAPPADPISPAGGVSPTDPLEGLQA